MPSVLERAVLARLAPAYGSAVRVLERRPAGGGSIHRSELWRLDNGDGVFVKCNPAAPADAFIREAEGLAALAAVGVLRTPTVLGVSGGTADGPPLIVLEAVETGSPGADFYERFGRALALHHQADPPQSGSGHAPFGWTHDNYLGATPQPNAWHHDWGTFFAEQRLGYQLQLAAARGHGGAELQRQGDRLLQRLPQLLGSPDEPACSLHGDLWGGNYLVDTSGRPVIIDPAVYCGRREADLAMTRLFGGFDRRFYEAYEEVWPLAPGSEERLAVYELYHLLNHLNLFGEGYLPSCHRNLRRLI